MSAGVCLACAALDVDAETTLPSAVEELARQRDERQRA
jgi:hypothetical protein